jgi:hypothetical protein
MPHVTFILPILRVTHVTCGTRLGGCRAPHRQSQTAGSGCRMTIITAAVMSQLQLHKADTSNKHISRNNMQFLEYDLGSCLKIWPGALRLRLGNLCHYGVVYASYGSRGLLNLRLPRTLVACIQTPHGACSRNAAFRGLCRFVLQHSATLTVPAEGRSRWFPAAKLCMVPVTCSLQKRCIAGPL